MKRFIGPLVLLLLLAVVSAASAQDKYIEDETRSGGGAPNGVWYGGPNSLPIGNANRDEALSHAYAMGPVQPLIQEFLNRGYIRTPQEDEAILQPNLTVVAVTFQKPGTPTSVRQPVILIASKKIGDYFVSQVYGGVVGGDDPNGQLHVYSDPPDGPALVTGRPVVGGGGRGTLRPEMKMPGDVDGVYDPAAFIPSSNPVPWSYQVETSNRYSAEVWMQYATVVGTVTIVGGLNGYRTGQWVGAAWGAVSAWVLANTAFWASH